MKDNEVRDEFLHRNGYVLIEHNYVFGNRKEYYFSPSIGKDPKPGAKRRYNSIADYKTGCHNGAFNIVIARSPDDWYAIPFALVEAGLTRDTLARLSPTNIKNGRTEPYRWMCRIEGGKFKVTKDRKVLFERDVHGYHCNAEQLNTQAGLPATPKPDHSDGSVVEPTDASQVRGQRFSLTQAQREALEEDPGETANQIVDEFIAAGLEPEFLWRAVRERRGQGKFREAVLRAYNGKCAITGTDEESALEAAHIRPYAGPKPSHVTCGLNHVTNGLALRADVHVLFDCHLLSINPETMRVVLSKRLHKSSYTELNDTWIHHPRNEHARPCHDALCEHFDKFTNRTEE